ncbi:fluoride efflux transporter CrcB [Moheibacter sediminis]|uniref:Fluoride-specific ion channel FluC n=1 Tax=Moheibacter sediminis TaxID=1434700 RepID=A0A1W2C911_9FLAO|nr:fluoride efflux transporter CrcB [Moheibacter sediminis]SMC81621.1 CrcB protein [Moheibacter sediminis]
MLKSLIFIGIGGAAGSILRFLVSHFTKKFWNGEFPLATFLVNLSGCLLIGLFIGVMLKWQNLGTDFRMLLIVGFCGGYTTFSAFALENFDLLNSGKISVTLIYALASVILGIVCVWAGMALSKLI